MTSSALSYHSALSSNHLAHTWKCSPPLFPYLSDSICVPFTCSYCCFLSLIFSFLPSFSHQNFLCSVLSHVLAFLLISASLVPWPFSQSVMSPRVMFCIMSVLVNIDCLCWLSNGDSLYDFIQSHVISIFTPASSLSPFLSVSVRLRGKWHQWPASGPLCSVEWNLCNWQPIQHPRYDSSNFCWAKHCWEENFN